MMIEFIVVTSISYFKVFLLSFLEQVTVGLWAIHNMLIAFFA